MTIAQAVGELLSDAKYTVMRFRLSAVVTLEDATQKIVCSPALKS